MAPIETEKGVGALAWGATVQAGVAPGVQTLMLDRTVANLHDDSGPVPLGSISLPVEDGFVCFLAVPVYHEFNATVSCFRFTGKTPGWRLFRGTMAALMAQIGTETVPLQYKHDGSLVFEVSAGMSGNAITAVLDF